jgi:hypothetical protein
MHVLALVYLLAGIRIPMICLAIAVCIGAFLPAEQIGIPVLQNWGWVLLTVLLAVRHRAAVRPRNQKIHRLTSFEHGYTLISWLPFFLVGTGIFFWVRQWIWDRPVPEILQLVHPIRTGLCGYLLYVVQSNRNGNILC